MPVVQWSIGYSECIVWRSYADGTKLPRHGDAHVW